LSLTSISEYLFAARSHRPTDTSIYLRRRRCHHLARLLLCSKERVSGNAEGYVQRHMSHDHPSKDKKGNKKQVLDPFTHKGKSNSSSDLGLTESFLQTAMTSKPYRRQDHQRLPHPPLLHRLHQAKTELSGQTDYLRSGLRVWEVRKKMFEIMRGAGSVR
jgi:hypothetical protein